MTAHRLLVLLVACQVPAAPAAPTAAAPGPAASVEPTPELGDGCRTDIPDCEAACALRETHRTGHLDWFDRRCAAVVLGKNPDTAVGSLPPPPREPSPTPTSTATSTCEPPYVLDANGRKKWKPECVF
jgi:hypothetical protein